LTRMCASVPVLAVLDDLQWADKPSLALLRHVVTSEPRRRLMIVAMYRATEVEHGDETIGALAGLHRAGAERVDLAGLTQANLVGLIDLVTGQEGDDELARALSLETDGNPFYARELLRHLAELRLFDQN